MKYVPTKELRQLVDAMLDGDLDTAGLERLEVLLAKGGEEMDYYLEMAGQDGLMKAALEITDADSHERPRRAKAVAFAIAALFLVSLCTWWLFPKGSDTQAADAEPLARVTDAVGVEWKSGQISRGAEIWQGADPIDIETGLLEIIHRSGTRLLLEGPARYEVLGENSGRFFSGKMVAEVPPGAEGFTVDYADGQVIDLGTEFALQANPASGLTEVGVFRGEIRVLSERAAENSEAVPLYTGHAVRMPGKTEGTLRSIPFDQESYVRRLPSRELPWYVSGEDHHLEWDVSHLIWADGDFLAILKWMSGPDALQLSGMELFCDGVSVSIDEHSSSVGNLSSSAESVYRLHIPEGAWRRGKWMLKAAASKMPMDAQSEGVLMIEDMVVTNSTAEEFVGLWEYVHDGVVYRRNFRADGTCTLQFNGQPTPYFESAEWAVKNGILEMIIDGSSPDVERHLLRDPDTLVFVNQPYRNARRVK